jgi:hypothetical protein
VAYLFSDIEYKDYVFKLIFSFTVLMALIGYLAETTYKEFFESIIKLAQSEEYSYIVVSFTVIFAVLYSLIRRIGLSYGIRPSKILFTAVLLVFSIVIYIVANLDLEYKVQLIGLSFVCVFIALLLLIYEPNTLSEIAGLLTLIFLIPIPTRVVDAFTPILSKHIGKIAELIIRASITQTQDLTLLGAVSTNNEFIRLSVNAACTSTILLGSLLVVIPLLVYIVTFSIDKPFKKALISLTSLLIALLIGLIGCFMRTILVLYVGIKLGPEQAYMLLYNLPSLIYSAFSAIVAFYFTKRYLKFEVYGSQCLRRDLVLRAKWGYITGVLLLLVTITSIMSVSLCVINADLRVPSITVNTISVSDYLQNPAEYLSTSRVKFVNSTSDLSAASVLRALRFYRVTVRSTSELYLGYIEVVDTPARLHTWEFYLTLQGYFVSALWSESIEDIRVNYVSIKRGDWKGVLAYVIIPTTIKSQSSEYTLYTRISLLSEESSNVTNRLSSIILSIIKEYASQAVTSRDVTNLIGILSQSTAFILSGLFIYFIAVLTHGLYKHREYMTRGGLRV